MPHLLAFLLLEAVCHSGKCDGDLDGAGCLGGVPVGLNSQDLYEDLSFSSPRYRPGTVLSEGLASLRLLLVLGEREYELLISFPLPPRAPAVFWLAKAGFSREIVVEYMTGSWWGMVTSSTLWASGCPSAGRS